MASSVNNWLKIWYGIDLTDEQNARWQFENVYGITFPDAVQIPWRWWDPLRLLRVPSDPYGVTWSGFWSRRPSAEEMVAYENSNYNRPEAFERPARSEVVSLISTSVESGLGAVWEFLRPILYIAFVIVVIWLILKVKSFLS